MFKGPPVETLACRRRPCMHVYMICMYVCTHRTHIYYECTHRTHIYYMVEAALSYDMIS